MKRGASYVLASVAVAALLATPARAAVDANGGQPGEWLARYTGARTLGMGGAFVATADNALGVLWNPAGLTNMERNELMFENARLFEDTSINGIGFAVPGSFLPSVGFSMLSLHSGDFQRTDEMNNPLGSFHEGETAYLVTLAKGWSTRFAVGANVKVLQQTVENVSAGGFGVDVGAMAHVAPGLSLGVTAANLGGPKLTLRDTPETFPAELRGGFAYQMFGGRGLVAGEIDRQGSAPIELHAGAEYWIQSEFALRVGVQDDRATGGLSYRFSPQYQLDYAVADHPLGLTHRIGIAYHFAGFFANSVAEPQAFSPTGEKATTQIKLVAHTKSDADHWTLQIVNKSGEVVRTFSGKGLPPAHVQWDGKDETGLPMADGFYAYRLSVQDRGGRVLTGPSRHVEITTSGPQGDVPVVTQP